MRAVQSELWSENDKNFKQYTSQINEYTKGCGYSNYRKDNEKKSIENISPVIAACMIFILIIQFLLRVFFTKNHYHMLDYLDFPHTLTNSPYFNYELIKISCISAFKYIVPLIFIIYITKFPIKNLYKHINYIETSSFNKKLLLVLCSIFFLSLFLINNFLIDTEISYTIYTLSHNNTISVIIGLVFYLLFIPILKETFFRGILLQITKRFGVFFSIIITTIVSTLITEKLVSFPITLILNFILCICTIIWGSCIFSIYINIFANCLIYFTTNYVYNNIILVKNRSTTVITVIFSILILSFIALTIFIILKRKQIKYIKNKCYTLTILNRMKILFSTVSMIIGVLFFTLYNLYMLGIYYL